MVANSIVAYSTEVYSSVAELAKSINSTQFQSTFTEILSKSTNGSCVINGLTNTTTANCSAIKAEMATTSKLYFCISVFSSLQICSLPLHTDFNFCSSSSTCPAGSYCTSLPSSYTYSCKCYSNYSVSGIVSSSPYIEKCTASTDTVVVVIAIVIPIVCGIAIFLLLIFTVFVVRTLPVYSSLHFDQRLTFI